MLFQRDELIKIGMMERIITSLAGVLFTSFSLLLATIPLFIITGEYSTLGSGGLAWFIFQFAVTLLVSFWCVRYTYRALRGFKKRPPPKRIINNIDEPLKLKDSILAILMLPVIFIGVPIGIILIGYAALRFNSIFALAPTGFMWFVALWVLHEASKD
jgi:hypothetical protein